MHLKTSSAKRRPFCPRGDELNLNTIKGQRIRVQTGVITNTGNPCSYAKTPEMTKSHISSWHVRGIYFISNSILSHFPCHEIVLTRYLICLTLIRTFQTTSCQDFVHECQPCSVLFNPSADNCVHFFIFVGKIPWAWLPVIRNYIICFNEILSL